MKRFKSGYVLLMMLAWACDGGNGLADVAFDSGNAVGYQGERPDIGGTGRHGALHGHCTVLRRFVEGRNSRRVVVPNLQRDLGPRGQSRFRTLFHESRRDGGRPPWRAKPLRPL